MVDQYIIKLGLNYVHSKIGNLMANQVSMGATMQCTFGAAPSSLVVLPQNKVMAEGPPAATIMDHIPMVNIMPFEMCNSPENPVIALKGPIPCVPLTSAPWIAGAPTVQIGKVAALDNTSKCLCSWGGEISFINAGTTKTMIP